MKFKKIVLKGYDLEYIRRSSAMFELKKVFPEIKVNSNVKDYIARYVNLEDPFTNIAVMPENSLEEGTIDFKQNNYINFKKLNDIHYLNSFLGKINQNLPFGGIFVCCAETLEQRKYRILNKYHKFIAYPYYYLLDFPGKRVFPKFEFTRKIHDLVTKGNNKTMSFTEVMGRLVYSGFRIVDYKEINNLTYFVADKKKEPTPEQMHSYGMIFKMRRVGKGGNIINVYKIRTMHPYSEYIQKYLFDINGSDNGDKIKNDFRVTSWGRFLRRYWLDELPMLINLIKGDLKIIGVRPLSETKLSLYPKKIRELRLSTKPGLIPPFYADLPKSFDGLINSEKKYIEEYKIHPLKTDIKYFFKCIYNIFIKGERSL